MSTNLDKCTSKLKECNKAFVSNQNKIDKLKKDLEKAQKEQDKLKQKLDDTTKQFKEISKKIPGNMFRQQLLMKKENEKLRKQLGGKLK